MPIGFGVVWFETMRGDWLETMLMAARKRGIDTTALLHATKTQGEAGWRIDQIALEDLLHRELGLGDGS
jgi:hypothetical protein